MGKQLTHQEFIDRLPEEVKERIEILGTYTKMQAKIRVRCKKCGKEHDMRAQDLHKGRLCSCDAHERAANTRRYSHTDFISMLDERWIKNIEFVSEYAGMLEPIYCKCKECGTVWKSLPTTLLQSKSYACPSCAFKHSLSYGHDVFLSKIPQKVLDKVEIVGTYVDARTEVDVKCKLCGKEYSVLPSTLFRGRICRDCSRISQAIKIGNALRKTHEQYVEELKQVNPYIEVISRYKSIKEKVKFRCLICGNEWETPAATTLHGESGCSACKSSYGERTIRAWLERHNIQFIPNHKFSNLRGIGGKPLSYDFYLIDYNALIEYQGMQHEYPYEAFGGEKQFEKQVEHDKRKKDYALNNNYSFLEIWYRDKKHISEILDDFISSLNVSNDNLTADIAV